MSEQLKETTNDFIFHASNAIGIIDDTGFPEVKDECLSIVEHLGRISDDIFHGRDISDSITEILQSIEKLNELSKRPS